MIGLHYKLEYHSSQKPEREAILINTLHILLALSVADREATETLIHAHLEEHHPGTHVCWLYHNGPDIRDPLLLSRDLHLIVCSDNHSSMIRALDADDDSPLNGVHVVCIGDPGQDPRDSSAQRQYVPEFEHLMFALGPVLASLLIA